MYENTHRFSEAADWLSLVLTGTESHSAAFAGYKDWFIKVFRRPGFTIEAGAGENPLPLSQFDEIYRDNLGILVTAAMG